MTDSETPPPRSRRFAPGRFILPALLLLAVAGSLMPLFDALKKPQGPVLDLGGGFRLRLVAVLGGAVTSYTEPAAGNPVERLLSRVLPEGLRLRLFGSASGSFPQSFTNASPDGLDFIFKLESDLPEWTQRERASATDLQRLVDRVENHLTSTSAGSMTARFSGALRSPDGEYESRPNLLYPTGGHFTTPSRGSGLVSVYDPFIVSSINPVPKSFTDLNYVLKNYPEGDDGPTTPVASIALKSPLHRPVAPLKAEGPTPLVRRDGNLEATLTWFVAGVGDDMFRAKDADGTSGRDLIETKGLFIKHGPADRNGPGTAIVLDLRENDRVTTGWAIHSLQLQDAEGTRLGASSSTSNPEPGRICRTVYENIGWIKGATDITVSLIRKESANPDETATVEVPFPDAGTFASPDIELPFWNGTATLAHLSHRGSGPTPSPWSMNSSEFTVGVKQHETPGAESALYLQRMILDDGETSFALADSSIAASTINGVKHHHFGDNFPRTRGEAVPSKLNTPTTATITIRSPRLHTFKFRAEAKKATVEPMAEER